MTEPDPPRRRGPWATLRRWRAPIVLVPLLLALGYSGVVGARMLWSEPTREAAPPPVVTCWDGTEAAADACPVPTGVQGLRWVFPSLEPGSDRCRRVRYDDAGDTPRPLEVTCRTRVRGGTAQVTYSRRTDLERGLRYLAKRYGDTEPEPTARGTRTAFRDTSRRRNGTFEVTVAYDAHPFSVTVAADRKRVRDRALRQSVQLRPARYVTVRPPPQTES